MLNGSTSECVMEMGDGIDERASPCSTFKIVLSLMGFDSGLLQNQQTPVWAFEEGYDDFLDSWKQSQTPQTWMKTSCIWFSRVLAAQLGQEKFESYLALFDYGNQDASGGLTNAWLSSSLQISPREQTLFIQKMLKGGLSVTSESIEMTKAILLVEELSNGWKLYGKTGWTGSRSTPQLGWFVGWIEKGDEFYPLAYNIRQDQIDIFARVPRVKELLKTCKIFEISQ